MDPSYLFNFVFVSTSIFLIIEAVFAIVAEIKKPSTTSLSQATIWIRSLLMIVLSVIILIFMRSSQTTSSFSGGGEGM